ncbi:OmpA family protein [Aquimarina sp. RZ0]|uniref:OmpA family protein n=1 Tax=Aquimarina sp. RZ0 TaxID=2607730 RepID=UPI0011F0F411|nr:OmpA family protein [Aquimarina sp. RZ0]KAA1242966.1 OmpA family protein [Aquimarina sp. RZ0]
MKHPFIIQHLIRILCILIITTSGTNAQEKLIAKANENFDQYAFIDAREIYLEVAKRGYSSADLLRKIADSYYYNADFENAVIWYERLVKKYEKQLDSEYLYRYAQCLKSIEKYDKSDKIMEKFNVLHGEYDKRAAFFRSTRYYLEFIEKQSGKFELKKIDINSPFSEHSPSFDPNGSLVFSSSRGGGIIYEWDKMPFLDLYTTRIEKGEIKDAPKLLKGDINTPVHESSVTFSKDGKTMYFTRNNYLNKKLGTDGMGTTLLKLYRATLIDNKWSNIEELPFNSNEYSIAHPTITSDGKKLYFSSDMPGSYGNSDIYEVFIHENGTFSTPKNLGDHINTEGRESFPYISKNGDLYFSSDGHVGLGGLDVFIAKGGNDIFSPPYNVGRPINSPYDDFSFIIDNDSSNGYFSSNRPEGKGSDDIYYFTQISPLDPKCGQYIEGLVIDQQTQKIIPNSEVILFNKNMKEINRSITDDKGSYIFYVACTEKFIVRAQQIGYIPNQILFETTMTKNKIIQQNIALAKSESYTKKIQKGVDLSKTLEIPNIYFDLDKFKIRKDAEIELQKIIVMLQKFPKLEIDIRSHTDSRANDEYNLKLSKKRANSTRNYLIKKGNIDPTRITKKGFGETQLINQCTNGVPCNKEQHEMNRRSEFIITNTEFNNFFQVFTNN